MKIDTMKVRPIIVVESENIYDVATVELLNTTSEAPFFRPLVKMTNFAALYGRGGPDAKPRLLTYRDYDMEGLSKKLKSLAPKSRRRVARSILADAVRTQEETRKRMHGLMQDDEGMQAVICMSVQFMSTLSYAAAVKYWLHKNVKSLRKEFVYIKIK